MIASGLAVEGSHGLGHPLHFAHPHMTFGAPPVPEFLRPLPKPAPLVPRYNGATTTVSRSKYEPVSVSGSTPGPVNLAAQQQQSSQQVKDEEDFLAYNSRLFPPPPPPPPPFSHYPSLPGPYGSLYPGHYTPLLSRDRPTLPPPTNPPLSPLEAFPSPHSAPNSPASTYSPPSPAVKSSHPTYRDRKFKVPSGKEGSLKHRILTTTSPATNALTITTATRPDVVSSASLSASLPSTTSCSSSSVSTTSLSKHKRRNLLHGSAVGAEVLPAGFNKGSLIQLANGELKRVEDMRTEDFVTSAERSPALRLDPSTVVRIEPSPTNKSINILTLSYGENKNQVEMESAIEHPYFVYGQGWASCSPEKTMSVYGLKCHRLQVGDVCISLSPRPSSSSLTNSSNSCNINSHNSTNHDANMTTTVTSSSSNLCKKRRWSAPDQFEAVNQQSILPTQFARKTND